ncbi:conserved hypothetical protein [Talaromyces stipitatus ATCC 10500]|uniref:Transcription factor domain-containing protein n=1 Tax=Talaromyces stipitatus (strain ATCC 10500 / CBS 375.48 / QM 6759 / NRRL 1006) TaxID=441959 RepID=B8MG48_TALSN|nr:uncharacterized protein TSTA_010330 [Talaromyces stipitatus ATCC 10500]EED15915.1 conserved hypothetical protein [Talaromyces stipitatus ATCC 10500]
MYDANMPVLRCPQCNKPFDKRELHFGNDERSESCVSCVKAKARCDHRRPECSRVQSDNIISNATESSGVDNLLQANPTIDADSILDDAFVMPDTEIANIEELDFLNPSINFVDLLSFSHMRNDKIDPFNSIMASPPLAQQSSTYPSNQQPVHANFSPHFSISIPSYLPIYNPRSLIQRPKMKSEAQRISNLIFHTLKSYPRMILQPESLPPFIHPGLMSESVVESQNLESLHNCISLMHMMHSRVRGSRKLFWRNVRMECERLCEEHLKMNNWELLAAMQALAMYLIVRLEEGETDYNHVDSLLVNAVTLISRQFNRRYTIHTADSVLSDSNRESKWHDWILEESGRRICVIYQVLNLLVYFEPADMCDSHKSGLIITHLPSRKQLWEASDEVAWKMEIDRDKTSASCTETEGLSSTAFGLTANGVLVRLDVAQGRNYCSDDAVVIRKQQSLLDGGESRPTANWEDWCAGMDGLGGLVMLAASLLG